VSTLYLTGATPLPGDQVPITPAVAPLAVADDVLTVRWVQPCETPGWAYLTGTWPDGSAGRVMVWLDHLVIRRPTTVPPRRVGTEPDAPPERRTDDGSSLGRA
jgi:hypothetical protein